MLADIVHEEVPAVGHGVYAGERAHAFFEGDTTGGFHITRAEIKVAGSHKISPC